MKKIKTFTEYTNALAELAAAREIEKTEYAIMSQETFLNSMFSENQPEISKKVSEYHIAIDAYRAANPIMIIDDDYNEIDRVSTESKAGNRKYIYDTGVSPYRGVLSES